MRKFKRGKSVTEIIITVSQIQKIERMKLMKKKMKKIVSILCMMSLLFSMLTVKVNASNDDIKVLVDGTELTFDVPPQIIDDYTMVPMRGIFEALGYDVEWDEENKQIVANRNSQFIIMTLNEKAYLNITGGVKDMSKIDILNNYGKILDVKPQLVNGRTLVPLRAIAEDSGCVVKWNNNTRTITIDSGFIPFDKKYSKIPIYYMPVTIIAMDILFIIIYLKLRIVHKRRLMSIKLI